MLNREGFTLMELMIVVSIIGIIAIIYPSISKKYFERAWQVETVNEIREIGKMTVAAQLDSGRALRWITGSQCTDCACRNNFSSGNINVPGCMTSWKTSITKIGQYTGMNIDRYYTDSWGYPYLLDENEDEQPCMSDQFISYGLVVSRAPLDPQVPPRLPQANPDPKCSESTSNATSVSIYQ